MEHQSAALPPRARPRTQLVIGVVRRGSKVLLVREGLGPDGELRWSLPGGGVEDGETLDEALTREIAEETGLSVGPPLSLAFVVNSDSESHPSALALAFEVDASDDDPDPCDDDIVGAEFVSIDEALRRLQELESATQREPIVRYLDGTAPPASTWVFRTRGHTEQQLAGPAIDPAL